MADEEVVAAAGCPSAADFGGVAPDDLGVMPDSPPVAEARHVGKMRFDEESFLRTPQIDQLRERGMARRPHGEVFTRSERAAVLEYLHLRQMASPLERGCREVVGPFQRRHADFDAISVVRGENFALLALGEAAEADA